MTCGTRTNEHFSWIYPVQPRRKSLTHNSQRESFWEGRCQKTIREVQMSMRLWSNREMPGCVLANIEGGHIPIYSCCISLLLLSSEKLHSFAFEFHITFSLFILKPSWVKSLCLVSLSLMFSLTLWRRFYIESHPCHVMLRHCKDIPAFF